MKKDYPEESVKLHLSIIEEKDGSYTVLVGSEKIGTKSNFIEALELYEAYMRERSYKVNDI